MTENKIVSIEKEFTKEYASLMQHCQFNIEARDRLNRINQLWKFDKLAMLEEIDKYIENKRNEFNRCQCYSLGGKCPYCELLDDIKKELKQSLGGRK